LLGAFGLVAGVVGCSSSKGHVSAPPTSTSTASGTSTSTSSSTTVAPTTTTGPATTTTSKATTTTQSPATTTPTTRAPATTSTTAPVANNDISPSGVGGEEVWEVDAANAFFSYGSFNEADALAKIWNIQPFSVKLLVGNSILTNVPANAVSVASGGASSNTVQQFQSAVFGRFSSSSYSVNNAVALAAKWDLGGDTLGAKFLIGGRLLANQAIG
jgi:hypothetical protein